MTNKLRLWFMLLMLFAVAICLVSGARPRVVQASGDEDFVTGEVVVKLTSTADLAGVATQHALDPNPLDQFGSRPIFRLRITDGES